MNTKKKILIIISIIAVIIIALTGTVAGMIITGKVAITTRQKLAKGLSDIGSKASISNLEKNIKEQEKLYEKPFETETTITGTVNKMELNNTNGMEEILREVENVVNNTKITNTLKADLKNNKIKENLKANVSDIVDEISIDAEYNNDMISLRSNELNEKYITFTKKDIESSYEYNELMQIFELLENTCKRETTSLYLTDTEKAHFVENYGEIFSEYITDNMLKKEKIDITIDGQTKECDNISFSLNKNQIIELVGKYLKQLEQDEKGRQIVIGKIQSVVNTFNEEDLEELIADIKEELLYLEDSASIKVSIYCTMFTTYGFNIEFHANDEEYYIIDLVLGKKEDKLNISNKERQILKAIKADNRINIDILGENEDYMTVSITTNGTQQTVQLKINDNTDNIKLDITIINEEKIKTADENTLESRIQAVLQVEDNVIDITLNIASSLKYVNSIEETTFTDSNSINLVTAESVEVQEYINKLQNNAITLVRNAVQNSKLIQEIYKLYAGNVTQSTTNQEVQNFNNMFKAYIGKQNASAMKTLLQQISNSNLTNESHKVSVSIVENGNVVLNSTTNPEEINSAVNILNADYEYEVLGTAVDSQGYITGIEIRKQ